MTVGNSNRALPTIGITMGDPSSIGPEIAIKSLSERDIYNICNPLIIGDGKIIENALSIAGCKGKLNKIQKISQAQFRYGEIDVYDLKNMGNKMPDFGRVSSTSGKVAFESVVKAIELASNHHIDATVTGPINKEAINQAGHHYSGHTEIFAHYTNTKKYAMLLVHENLRVIHVSTHVSLKQACELVKKKRIVDVIQLLDSTCRRFGIEEPKIGVAGLNPHASDGGLFGDEEEKEIYPAIKEARSQGLIVDGPIPADTLFSKAKGGMYDGCVAMYHDQGHIPFKLEGFIWDPDKQQMKSVQGVNITLGLPIIRCSVDHGTAFEIAGKGVASPDAMLLAIEYAVLMAKSKEMTS
jgi:4-hydroxythreonine-4-phosphate dehydrogenase